MARKFSGINPLSYLGVEAPTPPQFVRINRAPTANDYINFNVGTIWLDTSGLNLSPPVNPTNEDVYILVSKNNQSATWVNFGGGNIDTLTGDTGGAIFPDGAENITLAGGSNINTAGAGNTITINLNDVVDLPNTVDGGEFQFGSILFMHNYGVSNTFLGAGSGNKTLTGSDTVGIGQTALQLLTSGDNNTAVGQGSMTNLNDGSDNTSSGSRALQFNVSGDQNTAVGRNALRDNLASRNTALGYNAGLSFTTGADNVAIGTNSLDAATTVSGLTAVGSGSLGANTSGTKNTGVGYLSLTSLTTGSNNTALGYNTLNAQTTEDNNTALGSEVLAHASLSGVGNTGVGSFALNAVTTGGSNVAVGRSAGLDITTGQANTGVGTFALNAVNTGTNNVGIGESALIALTTGDNNTALGYQPAFALITGSYNVIAGYQAASNYTTSESSNIIISNNGVAAESNTIRIGTDGSGDNQQNKCFIAGIYGVTPSSTIEVPLIDDTGQFGSIGTDSSGKVLTSNGVGSAPSFQDPARPSSLSSFSVFLNGTNSNVTGDNSVYPIPFDTSIFDTNGDFNTGTGTFLAPVTGIYSFVATVTLGNLGSSGTASWMNTNLVTTAKSYVQNNKYIAADDSGQFQVTASFIVPMTANDTATFSVESLFAAGASKTVSVVGGSASDPRTMFMGSLL